MTNNEEKGYCAKTTISWYPGHMAKTIREIKEDLKLIDVVVEILDARIPMSSQNPEIREIIKDKKKIIVLNKSDLASEEKNIEWVNYFDKKNLPAILCNSTTGEGSNSLLSAIRKIMKDELENASTKGRVGKTVRVMILGIPNVGKSSIINRISNKTATEVGNKPGVTKRKQWIRLANNIELLDTPGVLWPKLDSEKVALNLAFTGTIKSEILEETEVAYNLTKYLINNYKNNLIEKYLLNSNEVEEILSNLQYEENEKIVEIMDLIGKKRGAIIKGGDVDLDKTSKMLLDDFKNGKIGRITLESPKV